MPSPGSSLFSRANRQLLVEDPSGFRPVARQATTSARFVVVVEGSPDALPHLADDEITLVPEEPEERGAAALTAPADWDGGAPRAPAAPSRRPDPRELVALRLRLAEIEALYAATLVEAAS